MGSYHAKFLLDKGRVAELVLPKDITPTEAEMIASTVRRVSERAAGVAPLGGSGR